MACCSIVDSMLNCAFVVVVASRVGCEDLCPDVIHVMLQLVGRGFAILPPPPDTGARFLAGASKGHPQNVTRRGCRTLPPV